MDIKEATMAIEAILFASGEPVPVERIAEVLELDKPTAIKLLLSLGDKLENADSALQIVRMEDKFQLCSKKQFGDVIRRAMDMRKNAPLSQASLEVLAIIAYNQPVTKSFLEQVRGVDCSGVVNSLSVKGLIEEKGRLDLPGRPLTYGTTTDFLRCFGISSLSELPSLPEYQENPEQLDGQSTFDEMLDGQPKQQEAEV